MLARPRVSRDGRYAVVNVRSEEADLQVWVQDLIRGGATILTTEGNNTDPIWTADGDAVTFASIRDGVTGVDSKPANGSPGLDTLLTFGGGGDNRPDPYSWSPDGTALAFYQGRPRSIWMLPLEGDRAPVPFLVREAFNDRSPSFSPDGRWLAYVSDESGKDEVYVTPYPGPGGRELVSLGGGREPAWSADGTELFYRGDSDLMAVAIQTEPAVAPGRPQVLFDDVYYREAAASGSRNYDVSPDGDRFLLVTSDGQGEVPEIHVVVNWTQELLERVPIP